MAKHLSSFQRNIIITTLGALICFSLLTLCEARTAFSDIDLSSESLDPDTTGFMITGNAAGDYFGFSVSTAGDIDNDGYDDIIISAPHNSNRGAVYVIYGGETSSMTNIALSSQTLDPLTTGFIVTGNAVGNTFGWSVSSAGDINHDGYGDIIIGDYGKNSNQGAAYVIYGGEKSSMSNIYLSTALDPATTGFMITGNAAGDYFGVSVSTAGDIDNDGYDDIIIGAQAKNSNQGVAYVIYGREKSSMSNIYLSTALDPAATGFMITGNTVGDNLGNSVRKAGDINNDGYDDIIVGAVGKNSNQGAAYVIYGGEKLSMTNINLSTQTLDPLTTGFMLTGDSAGDNFGNQVHTAGDIDSDGYDDIIVGAYYKYSFLGAVYVIYGGEKSSMSNIYLSTQTLDPLTTGFMITGDAPGDQFGNWVNTAGDINHDGYDDIVITACNKNSYQGAVYVIYGRKKPSMSNIALSTTALDPLTTGFKVTGNAVGDYFGIAASTAGDFNKDGFGDLIVGAFQKGAAYLISPAQCTTYCNECSSFTGCTECKDPYLLYQFECLDSCPNTTFTDTDTCQKCSTQCNLCSSSSTCTECIRPFVLYESYCLTSCPETMFNSNNVCKDCPSYCYSCASQDSCQVCFQGYTLFNSLCVLSSQGTQETATQTIASATRGIGSVVSVGSSIFPFSALVSKIVQNTRYLNLSVTSDLAEIYQTWNTDLISWDVPNVMSNLDHFETAPSLFAQFSIDSPFLVNFWPTLINVGIGFSTFFVCIIVRKLFENEKYEGWVHSLVQKLAFGSFNFALVQAYACLDDILFYLVIDAKTNPFNSFFSWASIIWAVIFLAVGCLLVFFNFWTVKKYQSIKNQGMKELEAFNEKNEYWELFYFDFHDNDFWSQSFFAILLIRSTLSSFIITVFYDYPLLQTSYLLILDGGIILFLYFKTPFNTLRGKFAQYYYEIITLLVHLCAFIISLQDSFENPSDTVKLIMSTGIIYLNTALITGAIGFMFIEIYKTISEKTKASRLKQHQSVPKDSQETQNLTRKVRRFQPSEIDARAQKRQIWKNREQIASIENFNLEPENNNFVCSDFINMESSQALGLNFETDNSILSDFNPSHRIKHHQRNQNARPIMTQHRPQAINKTKQRNRFRIPNHLMNNGPFSSNY